jgi:hypothetical protein
MGRNSAADQETQRASANACESNGFEILSDAISSTEITSLCNSLKDFTQSHSRAGIRHAMRHPAIARLSNSTALMRIAERILGGTALPFRATLFDKSPASNWLVVWHQDTALPIQERRDLPGWGPWSVKEGVIYGHAPASALDQLVALRVHLDDSGTDNGPLRVVPNSHKNGVLSDEEIQRLVAHSCPVKCTVPRGGVLAMRPLLVHSSSKSQTSGPRRVLHIEYARSTALEAGLELRVA